MTYTMGLDLGTTYTAAAVCRNGHCEISPLGNRSAVIPSVVHVGPDGTALVGEAAQRRLVIDPGRVAREFKRRIGDPTPMLVGGSPIAAEALTARLAKAVVATVAEREGHGPARITVTHPASWGPFKLDLLRQAMRMADLPAVTMLSEPEAAAWEYAATRPVAVGSTIAVYDLGGGTFDATLLRAGADGFSVLGEPEGIERFGGIDIDQAVFGFVWEALGRSVDALDPDDPMVMSGLARLRADCVDAKEALSSDHEASIPVVLPTVQTEVRITRSELESLIRPVMGDTVAAMRRALLSAGVTAADLSAVLLVGGSSRIPLVGEVVGEMLGRPVAVDAHPKHLVAMGAARHAAASGHLAALVRSSAATTAPPPATTAPPPAVPAVPAAPATAPPAVPVRTATSTPPPTADGADARSGSETGPQRSRERRRTALLSGVGVVVAAALVTAVVLFTGGGGGGGGDAGGAGGQAVDGGDAGGAGGQAVDGGDGCPTGGPFVCITDVAPAADGGLVATFRPVGVSPGTGGVSLVFFLADVWSTDHGLTVVANGEPLPWNSSNPFVGWSDEQLSPRSVVCAGVVDNGSFLRGSGNCANLP